MRSAVGGLALTLLCALVPATPAEAATVPTAGPVAGRVVAWGDQDLTAATPAGLTGIRAVATSGIHALALRTDGTVVAWGDDSDGESSVPPGLRDVTAIAAGRGFSIALRADGTLTGWGLAAQLGPVRPPPGLDRVVAVAAGHDHALALRSNGTVVGWGRDRDGQASPPDPLDDIVAVAAGGFFSAALHADGTVKLWGYSVELGDVLWYPSPERGDSPSNPVRRVHGGWYDTLNLAGATGALGRFRTIDAEYDHLLGVTPDGAVRATGSSWNPGSRVPPGLRDVTAVATGAFHNLALRDDGTVAAWGGSSPTAPGTPAAPSAAIRVPPGLRQVVAIAAGGSFNLAITTARE